MAIRSRENERRLRHAEGLLLLGAALIILLGSAALLLTKGRSIPSQPPLNINQATQQELIKTAGMSLEQAQKIIKSRKEKGSFTDVDALARRKLVSREYLSEHASDLSVRSWGDAVRNFLLTAGGLLLFLLASHVLVRRLQPLSDPVLLPIAALLSALGVLLLFSLKDPLRDMSVFSAQGQGVIIGGLIALGAGLLPRLFQLPLHRYSYIYAVAAIIAILLLGVLGSGPGGVRLSIAGIQPVEGIKILLVFFLASYLAERGPLLNDPLRRIGPFLVPRPKDTAPLLAMYALPLLLFALLRDMGPALLLFGAFLLMIYLATGRGGYVLLGVLLLIAGGYLGYLLKFGVFETRVDMWLSPWNNAQPRGDHLAHGLWGLASGGPLGSGLGMGGIRYIPRGGSDLAFASIGEEMGLPASLFLSVCFLIIAIRGLSISRRAGTEFERYLAAGLSGLMGLQSILIISGILGLMPLSGVTLPLISYGKSSLLASFFTIGLLLTLSARAASPSRSEAIPTPMHYRAASSRAGVFFIALLGVLIPVRLIWVQGIRANVLAAKAVYVPDADRIKRPHINPRLLEMGRQIPRGRILDRRARVLAVTDAKGKRQYPYGDAAGHLVGYLNPAVGGPTGFERQYQNLLRGYENYDQLLHLWRLKDIPGFKLPRGQDVVTTLDAEMQKTALEALRQGTRGLRDRQGHPKQRGAVVVLDVKSGGVLAAVTLPSLDPGTLTPLRFQELQTDSTGDFPLINRATRGYYPPGSTFKIAVAAALYQNNRSRFTYTCSHIDRNVIWRVQGKTYSRSRIVDDEGDRPHGLTGLSEAITASCNIYFAHAALTLGGETLQESLNKFHFSKLPSIDHFHAELPDIGYGQGPVLATPMEMAAVAGTAANRGLYQQPYFVKAESGKEAERILSADQAERLSAMMAQVTRSGTAAGRFQGLPFSVAGKTGTAQNDRYDRVPHSWFIGFAPADSPRVAFAVLVENGGYGAQTAAPIAREMLKSAVMPE